MASMKNEYSGELRTKATHLKSGNEIITDAPTDNMGKGEAFSPTDLVSASLSACMMTIMGQVANREGIDMKGVTTEVTKVMSAQPRRIAEIHVTFRWPEISLTEKQKELLKRAARTCPVALSLNADIKQVVEFNMD